MRLCFCQVRLAGFFLGCLCASTLHSLALVDLDACRTLRQAWDLSTRETEELRQVYSAQSRPAQHPQTLALRCHGSAATPCIARGQPRELRRAYRLVKHPAKPPQQRRCRGLRQITGIL